VNPVRFRLAAFLIGITAVGATIGFIARTPRYRCIDGYCDGFFVQGMWKVRLGRPSEFLYLVAYPEGEMHGGGATEWPFNPAYSGGVRCHPSGVYVQHTRAVPPDGYPPSTYSIWVYRSTEPQGDVRFVDIPPQHRVKPGTGDLAAVEQSEMWRRFVRPVLVEESLNWRDQYEQKLGGEYRASRFPRRSQIDWSNLDLIFARKQQPP
jgi:hypothetical protein